MPTIQRFRRCRIEMDFGDHRPPHFPTITNSNERVAVLVESLEIRAGSADPRDLDEALARAAKQRSKLRVIGKKLSEENE